MEKLADDGSFYAEASTRARAASAAFDPKELSTRYLTYFSTVLRT